MQYSVVKLSVDCKHASINRTDVGAPSRHTHTHILSHTLPHTHMYDAGLDQLQRPRGWTVSQAFFNLLRQLLLLPRCKHQHASVAVCTRAAQPKGQQPGTPLAMSRMRVYRFVAASLRDCQKRARSNFVKKNNTHTKYDSQCQRCVCVDMN